jgi:hypothetical protein
MMTNDPLVSIPAPELETTTGGGEAPTWNQLSPLAQKDFQAEQARIDAIEKWRDYVRTADHVDPSTV